MHVDPIELTADHHTIAALALLSYHTTREKSVGRLPSPRRTLGKEYLDLHPLKDQGGALGFRWTPTNSFILGSSTTDLHNDI